METIVFLETQKSGSSREAIRAAERLGYFTVVFTARPSFVKGRTQFPDVHLMRLTNLEDIDSLRQDIRRLQRNGLQVRAIVSFVDPHCPTAAMLSEEWGLYSFTREAMNVMSDKIRSRQALENTPYTPYYMVYANQPVTSFLSDLKANLPLMVKSPQSTGSKDVLKAETQDQLIRSIGTLKRKYPDTKILIEEFLDGPQYLVETLVFDGEVHIVAIFKQDIVKKKRFIVMGYNLLLDLPDSIHQSIREATETIIRLHGLVRGPCHLELRWVRDQWKLIEMNPRISGGAMNQIIEQGFGINLVEQTLRLALGQKPDLTRKFERPVFTRYVTVAKEGTLQRVTGKKKAQKSHGVLDVYIKPKKGTLLTPPLSMGHRYGYVMATGSTSAEAENNANAAAKLIRFVLDSK
ncbi:ATP-grasp domain-containing protein [Brevibacillus dissolubilis]|uniref:ATP-grasp domain-containing protein n=1 Tax=Brevibacillus dissolubilis TaxID=1844116 RepID=UPI00111698D7|nr:ATP-grasp domain-containing protein [Brevibacillus dissolubilis]